MFKVMAFLVKRPDITRDDLIEHYEKHHVPLILSLAAPPAVYQRNYVVHDDAVTPGSQPDIITELAFRDQAAYKSWIAAMYAPDSGVAADEATFLDRGRTMSITVEEHVTS